MFHDSVHSVCSSDVLTSCYSTVHSTLKQIYLLLRENFTRDLLHLRGLPRDGLRQVVFSSLFSRSTGS
jgi:hypothetical protein